MSFYAFLKAAFMASIALSPLVDPIGSSILANPLFEGLEGPGRIRAARSVAIYCLMISLVTIIAGSYVLRFFGLSIPVVQVGGGLLMCKQSWQMLSVNIQEKRAAKAITRNSDSVERSLFFPIAFPVMTGPETIAGLLTLSAHGASPDRARLLFHLAALTLAILIVCALIFLCLARTPSMIHFLGEKGELIVNQLGAFLFLCVGIQIAETGAWHIVQGYIRS